MPYRLSRKAVDDLVHIYLEGVRLFGPKRADAYHDGLAAVFELIGRQPWLARERMEISPPVRIHPFRSHLIVYEVDASGAAVILRVRHARENWIEDPV